MANFMDRIHAIHIVALKQLPRRQVSSGLLLVLRHDIKYRQHPSSCPNKLLKVPKVNKTRRFAPRKLNDSSCDGRRDGCSNGAPRFNELTACPITRYILADCPVELSPSVMRPCVWIISWNKGAIMIRSTYGYNRLRPGREHLFLIPSLVVSSSKEENSASF